MKIKEFLNPDWKKVTVYILLLLLFGFLGRFFLPLNILSPDEYLPAKNADAEDIITYNVVYIVDSILNHPFINLIILLQLLTNDINNPIYYFFGNIFYKIFPLFDFTYLYLFSCFLVWIYNKVKKK